MTTTTLATPDYVAEHGGGGSGFGTWTDLGTLGATETITGSVTEVVRRKGTLDQNCAITITMSNDQLIDLFVQQDATGGRAVTFTGVDVWVNGTPYTAHRPATGIDRFKFEKVGGVTFGYWLTVPGSGVLLGQDEGTAYTESGIFVARSMLDMAFNIPAGTFRPGDVMEITASGTYMNNSGTGRNLTFGINLDGVVALTAGGQVSALAVTQDWTLRALCRFEAVGDQNWMLQTHVRPAVWDLETAARTDDFATDKTLDLTFQASANTATQTFQMTQCSVRRLAA